VFLLLFGMAEPEPTIFDAIDEEADRLAEAAADADAEAGRVVPHVRVREWLKTLGTPDQQPVPYSWRK
jgi:predicted transcriptional regulator